MKKNKTHRPTTFPPQAHYIDSHCHLDMESYQTDFDQILTRAREANIENIITIGIDLKSAIKAVQIAHTYPNIFATIGVHPHNTKNITMHTYTQLTDLYSGASEQIKAFGEIGLDYFKNHSKQSVQKEHFHKQLELAQHLKLPIVIHNREADDDCYDILKSFPLKEGGIMHCFLSDYAFAKKILDLGLDISLSGVITFRNTHTLHEVAKRIPLNRMLVETDGPFLAPVPFRGKRNEPAHVRYTVACIAQLRGVTTEEVAATTTANAKTVFNIH